MAEGISEEKDTQEKTLHSEEKDQTLRVERPRPQLANLGLASCHAAI